MVPNPISTSEEGPPCILEVGMSLAPSGLYWTLALARTLPVWLPQSHWSIIEDLNFFSRDARLLARLSGGHEGEAREVVANTVATWREARDALGFESTPRLYWHEGGRAGAVLPKDGDFSLIERVDALAAGFDGRRAPARSELVAAGVLDALADCARDTAALAAALGGRHPLVLSPLIGDEEVPELVNQLQAIGVASTRIAISEMLVGWQRPLLAALATSGLAVPVAAGRLRLAVIAVVAPRAHVLPQVGGCGLEEIDRLAWNDDGGAAEAALWDDASAIWWELP